MLRRLSGLCFALLLLAASVPALSTFPTYAQNASPVAVDLDDSSDGLDPADTATSGETELETGEVQPASEPGNTWPGSSVGPVYPMPDVYITFGSVETGGNTTASEEDSSAVPPLPDGYRLDNARIVTIETTAILGVQYSNLVCLLYNAANYSDTSTIQLFHLASGVWDQITDQSFSSVASATTCGYTPGLGTFAAAEYGAAPTAEPTNTSTPLPTDTSVPTATDTIVPTATETLVPTDTATVTPTETITPTSTSTPSDTPTSSATPTETASPSPTQTPTPTASETSTPSSTPEPSETATSTSTLLPTATSTISPSVMASETVSPTPTPTATSTSSATFTATETETATPTATTASTSTTTSTPTNTPTFTASPTSATGQTQYALPNVWVIYSEPPSSGTTEGSVLDGSTLPSLPSPYRAANAWFFSISTSVPLTTNKQVCVLFESTSYADPSSVTLLRNTGTGWSALSGQVFPDLGPTQGTRCGYTTLLGAFVLAEQLPATATPIPTASRTATATPTPSSTATTPPTWTPTASNTPTSSATPTSSLTSVATLTPSPSPSATATATTTASSTSTPSPTSSPSATSTPTLAPGSYPTGTTLRTTTRVNLRSGASTSTVSRGVLPSGTVVQVTGPSTAAGGYVWVPVTAPSLGAGWIAGNYLRSIPTPTPTRTPAPPTATRTPGSAVATRTPTRAPGGFIDGDYVRTTTRLNLRSAPGTSSQVLGVLPSNAIGYVTGSGISSGGMLFYPVIFDGRPSGYVAGKYLRLISATPTATRTLVPTATIAGVLTRWTTHNVNMRSGAGTGYRIIATLPEGTRVSITGNPKRSGGYDWYPIVVQGIGPGWVAGKYLTASIPI